MAQQIAVIGLGAFGSALARRLTERGVEVIAVDVRKELVENIKEAVAVAVALDSTDERALRSLGIDQVDAAVISIGANVEANLLTAALLKGMGIRRILGRATSPVQERILRAVGIMRVINVEEEMGRMLADTLASPQIERILPLASGHSVAEVKVPPSFAGRTLQELALRKKHRINLVAIKRRVPEVDSDGQRGLKEIINDVPGADDVLEQGDVMVVVGSNEMIEKLPRD